MTRAILYFLGGALLCWLPLAALCDLKWHRIKNQDSESVAAQSASDPRNWIHDGLLAAAVTGPICVVPTTLSLVLALWSQNRSPSEQLMAVLGGMGLRMGAVLLVALVVFLSVPHELGDGLMFKRPEREYAYWGSLLVFYLFTLGWETYLAARGKRSGEATGGAGTRP